VRVHGAPQQVIDSYLNAVAQTEHDARQASSHVLGTVEIVEVRLYDAGGRQTTVFAAGDPVEIRVTLFAKSPSAMPSWGSAFSMRTAFAVVRQPIRFSTGSHRAQLQGTATVSCALERLDLVGGSYHPRCGRRTGRTARATTKITAPPSTMTFATGRHGHPASGLARGSFSGGHSRHSPRSHGATP
jgi:hypothetical protein